MGKIYIVCPECRQQLSFQEVPGYQNMLVECPKCHFKANAGVYHKSAPRPRGPQQPQGGDETATRLVFAPRTSVDVGQIRVIATNEVQYLREGSSVIGRRAQTSDADIQISNDKFMSRRHVRIDVIKKPGGYEHRLVEIGSTNIVKLNGIPIGRGDILKLKYGDVITLGDTDIRLESNRDEATRIG